MAELYDAFIYMLLLTLEDLGFCPKGEGAQFVEKGSLRLGGELPTDTDGGGLSACHPGQRGLFLFVEAVRQLRGECGPLQVPTRRSRASAGPADCSVQAARCFSAPRSRRWSIRRTELAVNANR